MELLGNIELQAHGQLKRIQLWLGDLTHLPAEEAVDVLVVSAFRNNYVPTPNSLIGALDRQGLSVALLAKDKEEDLRASFGCWMSRELEGLAPGLEFRRILCFEPLSRGRPSEVVGDIFRSLAPFLVGDRLIETVAMPLVACGNIGEQPIAMLRPLVQAAAKWMTAGLPLRCLKVFVYSQERADQLSGTFAELKQELEPRDPSRPSPPGNAKYDLFVSYSRVNSAAVDFFVQSLRAHAPHLSVFLDRQELDPGCAWQEKIYEALDDCRKVTSFYSPAYLSSKMCQEEYSIARIRERTEGGVLFPIFLNSATLPASWQTINYLDCREADEEKLREAARAVLKSL